jgi:hypothetical protein
MRYLLILLLVLSVLAQGQAWSPSSNLDKPYSGNRGSTFMTMKSVGTFFDNCSIKEVLGFLIGIQDDASTVSEEAEVSRTYWGGARDTTLINKLQKFYNTNTSSSEVFDSAVNTNYSLGTLGALPDSDYWQEETDKIDNNGLSRTNIQIYLGRNTTVESQRNYDQDILKLTFSDGSKYTIHAYANSTPLVLDLDGDGKLEASNGQWLPHENHIYRETLVQFDINNDGFDEAVEWVGPNDGLLITYTPGEKVTGKNLFGTALGFSNGYERLSTFDTNNDLKVSGEELANIKVWRDANQNAKVDAGEILTLEELGITELCVLHSDMKSYFIQNGEKRVMWDWYPNVLMIKKTR